MNDELKRGIAETLLAALNIEADPEILEREESLFAEGRLGLDSVDMVSAIVAVEKKFGVAFPDDLDFGISFKSVPAIERAVRDALARSQGA